MILRPFARWLLAPFACCLVVAPTIAGWAHERAHHVEADHPSAGPELNHDHAAGHDHGLPVGVDRTVGGDHADSGHEASKIAAGAFFRVDLAVAAAAPVGNMLAATPLWVPIPRDRADPRSGQARHPPDLPRGPPLV